MLVDLSNLKATTFLFYSILTVTVIYFSSAILNLIKDKTRAAQYAKDAKKKRMQRDQQIKQLKIPSINIPKQLEEKILNSDAVSLLELLKKGEATSEQILLVYFQRAITIGLDLELITEINFEEALAQARKCDKLRKENSAACTGILFGLPMSIKDAFILKGVDNSGGMASRLFNPAVDDGHLVKILKGEGAIPFVKSNIPQVMMTIESTNHIWGTAKNPWNKTRSVGGSSGGEGALVAARCSPLGLGNDIGGSIRIPATLNGVVGFKPTAERVTKAGTMEVAPTLDNILNMRVATGPIVKSARDVNLLMKALLNGEAHKTVKLSERDPYYMRKEWREDIVQQKQKLRIGYFKSVEFFPATPANQRAVDEAAHALKKRGHDVIEVNFPNIEEVIKTYLEVIGSEGDVGFLVDALKGEAPIQEYDLLKTAAKVPNFLRKPVSTLLKLLGENRAADLAVRTKKRNAYEYMHLIVKHTKVREAFFKVWEEKKLDAIMLPGFAYPAQKIGLTNELTLGACYTFLLNVMNMPAGALPVTVVKEGENVYPKECTKHHDIIYKKMVESMQDSVGLPVGVQIATLPWEEEKCVGIMIQLEEELQFVKKHPYPI